MLKTISSPANIDIRLKVTGNPIFLTSEVKLTFLHLREAFTKALILHHFDPEYYIWMETNASDYAIDGILSQLTSDSGQWNSVSLLLRKMILLETW